MNACMVVHSIFIRYDIRRRSCLVTSRIWIQIILVTRSYPMLRSVTRKYTCRALNMRTFISVGWINTGRIEYETLNAGAAELFCWLSTYTKYKSARTHVITLLLHWFLLNCSWHLNEIPVGSLFGIECTSHGCDCFLFISCKYVI